MSWIALYFAKHPKHALAIGGLVLVLLIALGLYMKGRHDAHARDVARQKIAVAEAVKKDTKADGVATSTWVKENLVIDAKQKELEDAVAKIPDTVPDLVAVNAGCVELRQHGISTADLPACQPAQK